MQDFIYSKTLKLRPKIYLLIFHVNQLQFVANLN